MINEVTLIGNLGRDPELKHTNKGTAVCNLSLATTHRAKVGDQWQDQTEWHRVTVWGKTAENVAQYCQKGKQIFVRGRIQTRSYEKDGQRHYATEIVAEFVKFLGSRASDAGSQHTPNTTSQGAPGAIANHFDAGSYSVTNEEIPF